MLDIKRLNFLLLFKLTWRLNLWSRMSILRFWERFARGEKGEWFEEDKVRVASVEGALLGYVRGVESIRR